MLSWREISSKVDSGDITIEPFHANHVTTRGYLCRLGTSVKVAPSGMIDPLTYKTWPSAQLFSSGMVFEPSRLYLANTYERIGSSKYVIWLSTYPGLAALGVSIYVSANISQLGPAHCWTLEITVVQPTVLYPKMEVGLIAFLPPKGTISLYNGRYTSTSEPLESFPLDPHA
jgi:dCTP deaminase